MNVYFRMRKIHTNGTTHTIPKTLKPVCLWLHTSFYDLSHSFPSMECFSPFNTGREVVLHYTGLVDTGLGEGLVKYCS